ncbi:hypothetical protein [Streptomyces sp. NBC_01618]|uniref:hypothetical protein n=1 Tax=Streptomyces sp. NBC_01618 TaxID=2975900 RepID=UPI00386C53D2|nr:hypothetical protein OH735_08575 [Streptomyces sp. NBC_01618]
MIANEGGWCSPTPGQDIGEFIAEFVASRPPLTSAEISELRTIFRPALTKAAQRAASEADTDAA